VASRYASTFDTFEPPEDWRTVYELIREYRERTANAPVDTIGCEEAAEPQA
jgi:hypothetical protein